MFFKALTFLETQPPYLWHEEIYQLRYLSELSSLLPELSCLGVIISFSDVEVTFESHPNIETLQNRRLQIMFYQLYIFEHFGKIQSFIGP